jgi:putative heme-binding domain-containing protein
MEPVVRLAEKDGTHPWIGAATLGVPVAVLQKKVFPKMAEKKRWNRGEVAYMERLLEVCAASAGTSEIAALLEFVGATGPRLEWVRALGAGFRAARTTLDKVDSGGVLTGWMESNARRAADGTLPVEERVAAIQALGFASERLAAPALFACLSKQQPVPVQSVAVEELLRKGTDSWTDAAVSRAGDLSRDACNVMVRALLARTDGALRLLAAVKAGQIDPTLLTASDVQSLVKAKDAKVAAEAMRLLAARLPPSREEMLGKYREAVSLEGDGDKGRTVFQQRCMACHVAEGRGMAVGPDLITVKTKGRDGLLGAIVDPNREVAAQYLQYTVQTKDHEILAGVVTEDTAAGMTIKMAGGSARTVERSRILSASSTGQSLMPEGLEAGMTVGDMADLLTFIETLR